jgi:hypothetical protein
MTTYGIDRQPLAVQREKLLPGKLGSWEVQEEASLLLLLTSSA